MKFIKNIFFILIVFYPFTPLFSHEIQNFESCFGTISLINSKVNLFSLRKYTTNGKEYFLAVNPNTLLTSIIEANEVHFVKDNMEYIRMNYKSTNYVKAFTEAEKNFNQLQNAGITHFLKIKNGVILTADLCPSKRPLDRVLFTSIIEEFGADNKPVPIALAITGLWMEKHKNDLLWIKELEQKYLLSVTWVNHSYNHGYDNKLPLVNNFLLKNKTNIDFEVLNTEKKMLEEGLLPSIFFRFPGLISDSKLFLKITGFGLIPVGSDAWLAKNQIPGDGSIILVHANGNEPAGISKFVNIIQNKKKKTMQKNWSLYDLRDSMINEINKK